MDIYKWNEFVINKETELEEIELTRSSVSRYAVMWTLINIFRFLMDWYDEWKKAMEDE